MNIAIYLGSMEGSDPIYKQSIVEIGKYLGEHGHTLIYGGSEIGLMGSLARAALEAGGDVIGVEPEFFVEQVLQLDGLTELIVTKDMKERKAKMIELADAYFAFPGGTGTIEEISEVVSLGCIGKLDGAYGYININGYYDLIRTHYEYMVEQGFLLKENYDKIKFFENLEEFFNFIDGL